MKQVQDDVLLHGKQRDPEQGQDHQLDRADLPEEGAVGDQRAGDAEVCVDEAEERRRAEERGFSQGPGGKNTRVSSRQHC